MFKCLFKNCHHTHYKPNGKLVYFNRKELCEWAMRNQVQTIGQPASLCIESLDTILPMSVKYTKDGDTSGRCGIFRSTFMPPDKSLLRNSQLPELVDEILATIEPD